MKLGMEVGLGLGSIVLDGDPAPPHPSKKGGQQPPAFRPMSIVAKRLDGSRFHFVRRKKIGIGPGHIVLDGDPAHPKGAQPPIFGPCLMRPNGCPSQLLLSSCSTTSLCLPIVLVFFLFTALPHAQAFCRL